MSRQYYYAESLGEQTHTGDTNYTTALDLSFTADDNSTYAILFSYQLAYSTAAENVKAQCLNSTDATVYSSPSWQPTNNADYLCMFGIGIQVFTTGHGAKTYRIQYGCSGSTRTAKVKNCRILALKLDAADQYAQQTAEATTTSASYADAGTATKTFTPATEGAYLILGCADAYPANLPVYLSLAIAGTNYGECILDSNANSDWNNWSFFKVVTLTAAEKTCSIQFHRGASGTVKAQNATILLLRLSTFDGSYTGETVNRATTTSSSYQDFNSLTQTVNAGDYLVFAAAVCDNGAQTTTPPTGNALLSTGAEAVTVVGRGRQVARNQGFPITAFWKAASLSGSKTWKNQFKSPNNSNTVGMASGTVCAIQVTVTAVTGNPWYAYAQQ